MEIEGRHGGYNLSEFVGELDGENSQRIRIDDVRNPAFWLQIRLTDEELIAMYKGRFDKHESA